MKVFVLSHQNEVFATVSHVNPSTDTFFDIVETAHEAVKEHFVIDSISAVVYDTELGNLNCQDSEFIRWNPIVEFICLDDGKIVSYEIEFTQTHVYFK